VFNYSYRAEWSPEDGEYVASSTEFPGATALGATAEDAIRELQTAVEAIIEVMIEDGQPIPEPIPVPEYSGQFRLRLPKALHARLAERAQLEGVSANALAQTYIALGLQNDFATSNAVNRLDDAVKRLEAATTAAVSSIASLEGAIPQSESANAMFAATNVAFGPCYVALQPN
jgi:predicted RNase H-like HicB family nuclease